MAFKYPYRALPLSIWADSGPSPVAFGALTA
jgi:hypothetical protein